MMPRRNLCSQNHCGGGCRSVTPLVALLAVLMLTLGDYYADQECVANLPPADPTVNNASRMQQYFECSQAVNPAR